MQKLVDSRAENGLNNKIEIIYSYYSVGNYLPLLYNLCEVMYENITRSKTYRRINARVSHAI